MTDEQIGERAQLRADKRLLEKARALIARGWAQGFFAYDAIGRRVPASSLAAVRWCAVGALRRAAESSSCTSASHKVLEVLGVDVLADWNDRRATTQDEVLSAFDAAISLVRSELEVTVG